MKPPSQSSDVGGHSRRTEPRRRSHRLDPEQRLAVARDGEAGLLAVQEDRGFRAPSGDEAKTFEFVARRLMLFGRNRQCIGASRCRIRSSARTRRESHVRKSSPTRGSPDDSAGEHSPGEVGEPAGTEPQTLASPLRALHARMILRSAAIDGTSIQTYAARVIPYLRDAVERRLFTEAVELLSSEAAS